MIENETTILEPIVEINAKEVVIQHQASHENAIYDICSLEGRILITGKFKSQNTKVNLEGYPNGLYNIYILDGAEVFKTSFHL